MDDEELLEEDLDPVVDIEVEDSEDASVSVHALQGTQRLHTLKIDGRIKKNEVAMLVDTGSTHNFLSHALVKSQRLPTVPCPAIKVTLADGSTTSCTRKIVGLKWSDGTTEFTSNFFALPLGG